MLAGMCLGCALSLNCGFVPCSVVLIPSKKWGRLGDTAQCLVPINKLSLNQHSLCQTLVIVPLSWCSFPFLAMYVPTSSKVLPDHYFLKEHRVGLHSEVLLSMINRLSSPPGFELHIFNFAHYSYHLRDPPEDFNICFYAASSIFLSCAHWSHSCCASRTEYLSW